MQVLHGTSSSVTAGDNNQAVLTSSVPLQRVGHNVMQAVAYTLTPPLASPRSLPLTRISRVVDIDDYDRVPRPSGHQLNIYMQAMLMFLVIALGCVDIILRQIVAKTLSRFSYMLSFATVTAYFPFYWVILLTLIKLGYVPVEQVYWVWAGWKDTLGSFAKGLFSPPYMKLFLIAALGDTVGNGLGYICTPYVSGPVHSLLAQFTIMFTALISMWLLRKRYSLAQILGLLGVEVAVLIGVIPNLSHGKEDNSSDPFFSLVLGGSCAFNAIAWVIKEKVFRLYKEFTEEDDDYEAVKLASPGRGSQQASHVQLAGAAAKEEKKARGEDSLHIFVVNSHVALFQLPLTLLLVPLAQATGQTHGQDVLSYMLEGLDCLRGSVDSDPLCSQSAKFTGYYVFFNILWNLTILLNVKFNGALATFVALKAISPCSAVLFAYVDWPLLHTTPVKPVTWVVFSLIVPFILFYVWASKQQQRREEESPATASCCWPLGVEGGREDGYSSPPTCRGS